jgi:hypothetical protein
MDDYKIKPLKSGRDFINYDDYPAMKNRILPRLGAFLIVGRSGSGKTVMMANLLKRKNMIHDFYDHIYIFCFSPSNLLLEHCPQIKEENIVRDDDPKILESILDAQKESIDSSGYKDAAKVLIILDDVIGSNKFMNSKPMKDLFFQGQNTKCAVWVCSQSYVKLPRSLRINAHYVAIFSGLTETEIDRLEAEHRPAGTSKDDFKQIISECLKEPYSFIYMDCSHPDKKQKFRKNFEQIIYF